MISKSYDRLTGKLIYLLNFYFFYLLILICVLRLFIFSLRLSICFLRSFNFSLRSFICFLRSFNFSYRSFIFVFNINSLRFLHFFLATIIFFIALIFLLIKIYNYIFLKRLGLIAQILKLNFFLLRN